jgi:hypothetical protein
MWTNITSCRLCGNKNLVSVLNLGNQTLTGVFPKSPSESFTRGPLELVVCSQDSTDACGLVQLRQSYNSNEMYGDNYGYRSSLNKSMVCHLQSKIHRLEELVQLSADDCVLDIGSNDGTSLKGYKSSNVRRIGMDPTGKKFSHFYPKDIELIAEFFSASQFRKVAGSKQPKIVTSIAMFYDLEKPLLFAKEIAEILAEDGIWHFEQSYLPAMLSANAYDTVCHEHLEYYALRQIEWIVKNAGLRIVNIEFNSINGGSFAVSAAKRDSKYPSYDSILEEIRRAENQIQLGEVATYHAFAKRVQTHRDDLLKLLLDLQKKGKKVLGYGASTKGNVLLQYAGIGPTLLPAIAEVNEEKFGRFTPGTHIPIISEKEAKAQNPDYLLVLPWHFKENVIQREEEFLRHGGKLIFPLPKIEIVQQ